MSELMLPRVEVTEENVSLHSVPKPGTYYLISEAVLDKLCQCDNIRTEDVDMFELPEELSDMLPGEIDLTLDESGVKKFYNAKRAIIYQDGELSILYYSVGKAHKEGLI